MNGSAVRFGGSRACHDRRRPSKPGRQQRVNLSVDAALLEEAKALGINLSRALELHLVGLVRPQKEEAWQTENRAGIVACNRLVTTHGVFSDKWRRF